MGTSLNYKISSLKEITRNFISPELIEEIREKTHRSEEEIFLLLKRFEDLQPDEDTFSISITMLKSLKEFKCNPYRDLFLNAIDIYKFIYEYLINSPDKKNYPHKELFNIHKGYNQIYEKNSKDLDQRDVTEDDTYFSVLLLEDDNYSPNTEMIINFKLFCLILDEFNHTQSIEKKFKLSFNVFDINKDNRICYKDLKNFFTIILKNYPIESKFITIEKFSLGILSEFKGDKSYLIDFSNFQKIMWATNFITNITIEP